MQEHASSLQTHDSVTQAAAMQLLGGMTSYALPAPAGRWVNMAELDPARGTLVSALAPGSYETDYPFACREGRVGSDHDVKTQLNPDCAGLCPPGKICPAATHTPEPCTLGSYCAIGSAAGTFCPPGTFGNSTSLTAKEECSNCPPGNFCQGGFANPCARSYTLSPSHLTPHTSHLTPHPQPQARPHSDLTPP